MEEEEKLRSKIMNKKRLCLHLEKQQQLNDLLDLQVPFLSFISFFSLNIVNAFFIFRWCFVWGISQIAALQPVALTSTQFTEEYKTFASAIDTTRHELPIKNLHVEEDKGEFLGQ